MAKQKATMDIDKAVPALDFNFDVRSGRGVVLAKMREVVADLLEAVGIPELDEDKQRLWSNLLWAKKPLQLDAVDFKKLKEFLIDKKKGAPLMPIHRWHLKDYFENLND